MDDLLLVLIVASELLSDPGNQFEWSDWRSAHDASEEIDQWIEMVKRGQKFDHRKLSLLFAPTGNIQEVSLNSGWGDQFLELAEDFDRAIKKIRL